MTRQRQVRERTRAVQDAPWYAQFWPWFLILLPASAVAASVASLIIALDNADPLVRADWSRAGDEINVELGLEREAARRGIAATLALTAEKPGLSVTLDGEVEGLERIEISLRHPTDATRDLSAVVVRDAAGPGYFTALPSVARGSWHLTIAPPDRSWLLRDRVWLDTAVPVRVAASATESR